MADEFKIKKGVIVNDTTPITEINDEITGASSTSLVTEKAIVDYVGSGIATVTTVAELQEAVDAGFRIFAQGGLKVQSMPTPFAGTVDFPTSPGAPDYDYQFFGHWSFEGVTITKSGVGYPRRLIFDEVCLRNMGATVALTIEDRGGAPCFANKIYGESSTGSKISTKNNQVFTEVFASAALVDSVAGGIQAVTARDFTGSVQFSNLPGLNQTVQYVGNLTAGTSYVGGITRDEFTEFKNSVDEAPVDGRTYGRKDAAWSEVDVYYPTHEKSKTDLTDPLVFGSWFKFLDSYTTECGPFQFYIVCMDNATNSNPIAVLEVKAIGMEGDGTKTSFIMTSKSQDKPGKIHVCNRGRNNGQEFFFKFEDDTLFDSVNHVIVIGAKTSKLLADIEPYIDIISEDPNGITHGSGRDVSADFFGDWQVYHYLDGRANGLDPVASQDFVTKAYADINYSSTGEVSQLHLGTEGGNTGWWLEGDDRANKGTIGDHAIDLSFNYWVPGSTTYGATGQYAHAEGSETTASGVYSHAECGYTIASGDFSHAEGSGTIASGNAGHSEGSSSLACSLSSHAEGTWTIASGEFSHTEGGYSHAVGTYSHAEGYETKTGYVFGDIVSSTTGELQIPGDITQYLTTDNDMQVLLQTNKEIHIILAADLLSIDFIDPNTVITYQNNTTLEDNSLLLVSNTNTQMGQSAHAEGTQTTASGLYSHAEGLQTIASSDAAHAEGTLTTASGVYSHAEGRQSIASGETSHAEGLQTIASGYFSHAEGRQTLAVGNNSHAEGGDTIASGQRSHTEGQGSIAIGEDSHAEGTQTITSGYLSHAEGGYTKTGHVFTVLSSATTGQITIDGNRTTYLNPTNDLKVFLTTEKQAYIVPYSDIVSIVYSDPETIITYTNNEVLLSNTHFVIGNIDQIMGQAAHAEGWESISSGFASHAEGNGTLANGYQSHAEGYATTATGESSHSEGFFTTSSGAYSHAEGSYSTASGENSHAAGNHTTASGSNSTAIGNYSTASGSNSTAGGNYTVASGSNSTTFGDGSQSLGSSSLSVGPSNKSVLDSDISLGRMNTSVNQLLLMIRSDSIPNPGNPNDLIIYIKGDYTANIDYTTRQSIDLVYKDNDINTLYPYSGLTSFPLSQSCTYDNIEDETLIYTFDFFPPFMSIVGVVPHTIKFDPMTETVPSAATAIGMENIAGNAYAMATGQRTKALGKASFASGFGTTAYADYSHAEGNRNTILSSAPIGAHVEGVFAIDVTTDQQSVIGIGVDDADRKNGMVMWTDGTMELPESTTQLIDLRGDNAVVTKGYVGNYNKVGVLKNGGSLQTLIDNGNRVILVDSDYNEAVTGTIDLPTNSEPIVIHCGKNSDVDNTGRQLRFNDCTFTNTSGSCDVYVYGDVSVGGVSTIGTDWSIFYVYGDVTSDLKQAAPYTNLRSVFCYTLRNYLGNGIVRYYTLDNSSMTQGGTWTQDYWDFPVIVDRELVDGNGVHSGMALAIGSPTSTFSISSGVFHKINGDDTTYAGVTNQTVTNIGTQSSTNVAIRISDSAVIQQATEFTPEQRRTHVILGKLIHTNNTVVNVVNNQPDVAGYTLSQLNDFMDNMKAFNVNGNVITPNGANLSINKSLGVLYQKGINFDIAGLNNPHAKTMAALVAPSTLRMRQSNSVESANTNVIDLQYESPLGTLTPIPNNRYGVFRVVLFPSNLIRIQYPQFVYQSMVEAQAGIASEGYLTESNMSDNGLLRGYIIVRGAATALNTTDAKFLMADKFGEMPFGGSGGGTTTLQGAYDNSIEPEIITDSTLGAVSIQRGSAADTDNVLEIKNGAGVVQLYAKGDGENNFYPYADVKDPTGFTDPENITVTYDSTARTVTLTGTVKALWRGKVVPVLVSGWVSDPHSATTGVNYYLYYNGTSFVWQTTVWTFDMLQIAEVYYGATNKFAVREPHGFMDYSTHTNLHANIGTYKKSGGAFSSFTPGSTTATNRRPVLASSVIVDEDIPTTNASVSSTQYTRFNLLGASVGTYTLAQTDFVTTGGTGRANYNLNTAGNWTVVEAATNSYGKWFVVNIPVTSDAGSQAYRTLYVMPQTVSTTLATIQAITPSSVSLGLPSGATQEFVFVGEIIVQSTTNNWQITSITSLTGGRYNQVSTPASTVPGLSQVLTAGPDATDLDIVNLDNLDVRTVAMNDPVAIEAQLEIKTTTTPVGSLTVTGTETGTGPAGTGTADGTYTFIGGTQGQMTNIYRRGTDNVFIGQVVSIWIITNNVNPGLWTDGEYYLNSLSPVGSYTPIAGSGNVAFPTVTEGGSLIGSTAVHTNGDIIAEGAAIVGKLEVDNKLFVDYQSDAVTFDTNGAGTIAYAFKQGSLTKMTINTDNSLTLGTLSYTPTNAAIDMGGSVNGFYQTVIQNTNAGAAASADVIVNNNLSTDTTYYGDFGINSSNYTGAGSFQLPNATYLYANTGELVLGTKTVNGVRFVTSDSATDSARILATGEWGIGATPTTGAALTLPAGIAGKAPLNIGAFSATKGTPVDGDVWKSAADSLVVRMGSNTRTLGFLEKAQTWIAANTFSATANAFTNATDVTVGTFTTGSFYTSGGASITKTLQAAQVSQKMQSSATTTGSITWALDSGGNIDLTAALTGDITLAMSGAVAGSTSKVSLIQGSTTRAITLSHTGVTFNFIGRIDTGASPFSIPATEFSASAFYTLELYWATSTKCYVSVEKHDRTLWTKTVTIEAPTSADDVTIFRTDVAITVREVIAVSTGTTPSTTYVLRHDTSRDAAGTLVTTSAATTSKTTGDTATLSDATIPADSWIWLETTAASGTSVTLTVDIRYTID